MQPVPPEVWANFERRLDGMRVPPPQRPDYRKWVRFYFDFCHKYGHSTGAPASRGPFLAKLASKNQSVAQRSQGIAATCMHAVPERACGPAPRYRPVCRPGGHPPSRSFPSSGSNGAITCTNLMSRAPSNRPQRMLASPNGFRRTSSVTPLQVIYCGLATTSRRFRSCWVTATSRPR